MLARQCDICGTFYDQYEDSDSVALCKREMENKLHIKRTYDFCPKCMEKLENILNIVRR